MFEALEDHEGSTSIGDPLRTNFHFTDKNIVNAEEKEEADSSWFNPRSDDKQPSGFHKEIKINEKALETVVNLKYLNPAY